MVEEYLETAPRRGNTDEKLEKTGGGRDMKSNNIYYLFLSFTNWIINPPLGAIE